MTIRLPLMVGAMIFVVAVTSTQIAIHALSGRFEKQIETVGRVYLDGLAAALLPDLRRDDEAAARRALDHAFAFHEGVAERRIVVLDGSGQIIAQAARADLGGQPFAVPEGMRSDGSGLAFDDDGMAIWTWRPIEENGRRLAVVGAHLDIAEFAIDMRRLRWLLIFADLLFSSALAIGGFFLARRLQRPLDILTGRLRDAADEPPQRIGERDIPVDDSEAARMLRAYNRMVDASQEREDIVVQVVKQEREAVLGRLIATIAHEVRNPLAGILTAVGTARKFGERPEARASALDFIERGILALQAVVEATLDTHRAHGAWRDLRQQDIDDMQVLVAAEAKSRGVTVDIAADLADDVPVGATEVRQILLNLLLNAVAASPPGGIVKLRGQSGRNAVEFDIWDEGSGMTPDMTQRLEGGEDARRSAGLGIEMIATLVKRLHGHLAVESTSVAGTHVSLRFPYRDPAAPPA
ncbi:MAG: ATP-binding protein [Alphaproteobacteria bacterium]